MTLDKRIKIAGKKSEVLNKKTAELKFSEKTQFEFDNKTWTVKRAFVENNSDMVEIVANDGTVEIMLLSTLLTDKKHGTIEEHKDETKKEG